MVILSYYVRAWTLCKFFCDINNLEVQVRGIKYVNSIEEPLIFKFHFRIIINNRHTQSDIHNRRTD